MDELATRCLGTALENLVNHRGFMLTQLSPLKLALVLALVVLLFGAKRIPALAESIGNAIKKFKNTQKDEDKSS